MCSRRLAGHDSYDGIHPPGTGQLLLVIGHTIGFQNAENLVTSDNLDLSNAMAVTEDDTNLRWSCALLRQLADLVHHLVGGGL